MGTDESSEEPTPKRLRSLDALRGFDMFWIVGGRELVGALALATGWLPLRWMAAQCQHVDWDGFAFWDLIFPLFLFLAGVSMPFSLTKRVERGDDRRRLHLHVIRRGLLLALFGVLYNNLLRRDLDDWRYASVLGRIGLAYLGAGIIVLNTRRRGQCLWIAGLLLGYWAALSWVPVPEHGAGQLQPGANLTDFLDQKLVPGRLHKGNRDPEGLAGTVPAVATALLPAQTP